MKGNGFALTGRSDIEDCWNRIGVWSSQADRCPRLQRVIHCRNCPVYSSAGRRLLDRELPQDYQDEWTSFLAMEKATTVLGTRSAFVFRAGVEWMALPATLVQEVVNMGPIHSIPHRRRDILRGVVNIRGKLEICCSIGAVLGIDRYIPEEGRKKYVSPERLVAASREGQTLVFPVSEVLGVLRYAPDKLQRLPITVSGSKAAFTKGILCLDGLDIGFLEEKVLFETILRSL